MSETVQYTVTVHATYEHKMTVDIDMDAYTEWLDGQLDTYASKEQWIEGLLDEGETLILPEADEGEFYAYDIADIEPSEESL